MGIRKNIHILVIGLKRKENFMKDKIMYIILRKTGVDPIHRAMKMVKEGLLIKLRLMEDKLKITR